MKKINKKETTEFSFILKPSKIGGVGVFATHDIEKGTYLRLMGDENEIVSVVRNSDDIPNDFGNYCISREDRKLICPERFDRMHLVWYLNHSKKNSNACGKKVETENGILYEWYAKNDIDKGDEILIDYNLLEEPEVSKEEYYKK